jgi:phage tail sheath protein FI
MPVAVTYPGVYIDELPSAVRTIIGVPTSTTAFVGSAARGPVNQHTPITSWADFERIFGGLSAGSKMSYAVYQYYLNGGTTAEIVRLTHIDPATKKTDATPATLDLTKGVELVAKSPGAWGGNLQARVDYKTVPPNKPDRWNLTVRDSATGATESFLNIILDQAGQPPSASNLDAALMSSNLVQRASGGALDQLPDKSPDVQLGKDPWADSANYVKAQNGSDGSALADTDLAGDELAKSGIWALLDTDIFNLLCLPDADSRQNFGTTIASAADLCGKRRAIFLMDSPKAWTDVNSALTPAQAGLPITGDPAKNAAIYFPRIQMPDPLQNGVTADYAPCGVIAGVCARTDAQRGVWKAPAGTDASLNGVTGLSVLMTDLENGELNPLGVNCLRTFPIIGPVAWGARTMAGADALTSQWKYLPVRRTALFIEESLYRGTKWVVFEPNDEPLWASIRLNVGAFMNSLFRQGAFQGSTPREAYLVKCDKENNPQNDIDRGIVNILVGFAPLKPAEFVIIHIEQLAGQLAT